MLPLIAWLAFCPFTPGHAQEGEDPSRLLIKVEGPRGFKKKPSCPMGAIAVPTSSPFQPFRCVMGRPGGISIGAEKPAGLKVFRREEVSFQFPSGANLTDGWSDDPPAAYLVLEPHETGKPVTIFVSRIRRDVRGYRSLETWIEREKEDLGAEEGARGKISNLPARFTKVGKESRTAYVAAENGTYYTIAFSCPEALFEKYFPTYQRLLKSFRVSEPR